MRRKIILFIIITICFVLQTTLFKALAFANISPNLLLIVISSFGFMRGKREGMFLGACTGLLMDISFGPYIGLYTLIYMYVGYINGMFKKYFYPEDIKLPMLLIGGSDIVLNFILYFLVFLFRGRSDVFYYFKSIIIPEFVYTMLITVFMYYPLLKINEWLEVDEKRRAKKFE